MKNLSLLFLLSVFIFSSCKKKDDAVADAVACFSVDATQSTDSMHNFLFDQCDPIYDLSYWDFDDGQYSSNPNPAHVFEHYGTYNVTLTATNSIGHSSSVTHTITIGHYSLDKIVFTKMAYTTTPFYFGFSKEFNPLVTDTLFNLASLPVTHQFPDSTFYDCLDSTLNYYYYEDPPYFNHNFHINPSQIINNQMQIVYTSPDTSEFTLHFKFVPR